MSGTLIDGQVLLTESGEQVRILSHIGEGTQGHVYRANWNGADCALKWYSTYDRNLCKRLIALSDIKSKDLSKLLLPRAVIKPFDKGFGYLMDLRPDGYGSISDYLARKINPSYRALLTASRQIVMSFRALHREGYSYCDLSPNNVFIDENSGDILICDTDNILPNGDKPDIMGTPKYMAPELVEGKATPNAQTDRWALGVLLFMIFTGSHPFEGELECKIKCMDEKAVKKIYGEKAIYIFHPTDKSNRPDPKIFPNAQPMFSVLPEKMQNHFERLFTACVNAPENRPDENEWMQVLVDASYRLIQSPYGSEYFVRNSDIRGQSIPKEYSFMKPFDLPPILTIKSTYSAIPLVKNLVIKRDILDPLRSDPEPLFQVLYKDSKVGLKFLGPGVLTTTSNSVLKARTTGDSFVATDGLAISLDIGSHLLEGKIIEVNRK